VLIRVQSKQRWESVVKCIKGNNHSEDWGALTAFAKVKG
jgi:hypothetical protein